MKHCFFNGTLVCAALLTLHITASLKASAGIPKNTNPQAQKSLVEAIKALEAGSLSRCLRLHGNQRSLKPGRKPVFQATLGLDANKKLALWLEGINPSFSAVKAQTLEFLPTASKKGVNLSAAGLLEDGDIAFSLSIQEKTIRGIPIAYFLLHLMDDQAHEDYRGIIEKFSEEDFPSSLV